MSARKNVQFQKVQSTYHFLKAETNKKKLQGHNITNAVVKYMVQKRRTFVLD